MIDSRRRGQSEVVSTLLLAGLLIVTLSVAGGFAITNYIDRLSDDTPLADCDIGIEDGEVTITHTGGESLAEEDIDVILRDGSPGGRYDAEIDDGDEDARFEPGESITAGSVSTETDVLLVTADSVVCEGTVRPEEEEDEEEDEDWSLPWWPW